MKVVSGKFRGLNLKAVPTNNTRPTSAKVKEAVFSMLSPYMVDGVALDLFAGTGSLGIEAVSRGYQQAYLVDKAYKAINTIKENVEKTREEDSFVVIKSSATEALRKFQDEKVKFDLVFLDPPYRMKITEQIISDMVDNDLLNDGAVIVDETDYDIDLELEQIELIKEKRYKDTKVVMYRFGG
ncbi:16S rRNA (guanine(966)-N(2))-methyltransferase RsmD [Companilactobacillus farciminis]|uniref:16S rRNA (guanine(966)-N(2))-methyltransferase RsmD n=1 Tax=Companilactobacillus farciminis TaxID=1612 RepID=UPI00232AF46F|nr:16S rRNA (guanine(966)-N(2))-methyltransferase RsmD [Companilactobacillus farciminis]WCG34651.1 16S rRNA (guanine(966)-N(2))-methyltransferase RsmD [Companilactobacillus farciminis]